MKSIIFFYPDFKEKIRNRNRIEFPPIGLLSIAAIFEKYQFDVQIFPVRKNSSGDDVPRADIFAYGITASITYPYFLKLVPKIKHKAKVHIAGNAHATAFSEKVFEELELDAIFKGEAEETITEWCKSDCRKRGIIEGRCSNINDFPFPARHLLPENLLYLNRRLGGNHNNIISMTSSRGCVYRCAFCSVSNRNSVSFKTPEYFENEVQSILKHLSKCKGIVLLDENFTYNTSHLCNITRILRKYNLPYECNSRADTADEEKILQLKKTGCKEIKIGVETGSKHLLKRMKKHINLDKTEQIIKKIHQIGVPVKIYLMHGFPGENMSTTKETIECLTRLMPYLNRVALYRFVPLPGSFVFQWNGIEKKSWSKYSIYHNDNKWWGDSEQYIEVCAAYKKLNMFIKKNLKR